MAEQKINFSSELFVSSFLVSLGLESEPERIPFPSRIESAYESDNRNSVFLSKAVATYGETACLTAMQLALFATALKTFSSQFAKRQIRPSPPYLFLSTHSQKSSDTLKK